MRSVIHSKCSFTLCFIALIAGVFPSVVSSAETEPVDNGCEGGTCPSPSMITPSGTPYNRGIKHGKMAEGGCGLWMGPSPIKKEKDHGFGLGIFTGNVRRLFLPKRNFFILLNSLPPHSHIVPSQNRITLNLHRPSPRALPLSRFTVTVSSCSHSTEPIRFTRSIRLSGNISGEKIIFLRLPLSILYSKQLFLSRDLRRLHPARRKTTT